MSRAKRLDANAVFAAFCRWTARHPDCGLAELRLFDDGSGNVFDRLQEMEFHSLSQAVERLDADALPARRTSSPPSPRSGLRAVPPPTSEALVRAARKVLDSWNSDRQSIPVGTPLAAAVADLESTVEGALPRLDLDALVCRSCGAPLCACESCEAITRREWLERHE